MLNAMAGHRIRGRFDRITTAFEMRVHWPWRTAHDDDDDDVLTDRAATTGRRTGPVC